MHNLGGEKDHQVVISMITKYMIEFVENLQY